MSINSNRSQQKYDRAGNATRQGDRTETTAYKVPVVQSIVKASISLVNADLISKYTVFFHGWKNVRMS